MTSLRIAAAQAPSIGGDLTANLQIHMEYIRAAQQAGVDLLLFPELSLMGYELEQLQACALVPDDSRLLALRALVESTGVCVVLGSALRNGAEKPRIGAVTFFPDGSYAAYGKRHLHAGEELVATPGTSTSQVFSCRDERVGMAICADISHPEHAVQAANAGATLYLAGVLESPGGYLQDAEKMQAYARQHKMGTLMANHNVPSGGYQAVGKSAFWAPGGELVIAAQACENTLVIAHKQAGLWHGELHPVAI